MVSWFDETISPSDQYEVAQARADVAFRAAMFEAIFPYFIRFLQALRVR